MSDETFEERRWIMPECMFTKDHAWEGVLFPCQTGKWASIQACGTCKLFKSDDDAAMRVAASLPGDYGVAFVQVRDDPEEAGAWAWLVQHNGTFITVEEGVKIADEAGVEI
jgi:hypothetical protein